MKTAGWVQWKRDVGRQFGFETLADVWQVKFDRMVARMERDYFDKEGHLRLKRVKSIIARNHKYNQEFAAFYDEFCKALIQKNKVPRRLASRADVLFRVAKNTCLSNDLSDIEYTFESLLPAIM
jgi:hypothetical protein